MREEYREANKGAGWVIGWIIIVVLVIAGLGAGGWAIGVAVSGPKGAGDGYAQKNSAENWLDAQARFEENYADYESTLFKIQQAADQVALNPDDKIAQTNLNGIVNYCATLVSDYNADARNYLREDFRDADLPDKLDPETCAAPAPTELP